MNFFAETDVGYNKTPTIRNGLKLYKIINVQSDQKVIIKRSSQLHTNYYIEISALKLIHQQKKKKRRMAHAHTMHTYNIAQE